MMHFLLVAYVVRILLLICCSDVVFGLGCWLFLKRILQSLVLALASSVWSLVLFLAFVWLKYH